ncbi:MAG: hypothetical protein R3C10_26150 [Pirellulales bacterium]
MLLAVAVVGIAMLAVAVRPKNLVADPPIFFLAGAVLLTLCLTAFYFAVPSYWLGCVHSFRWDGRCLEYRTALSRTRHLRFVDEIEDAIARRTSSSQGSWNVATDSISRWQSDHVVHRDLAECRTVIHGNKNEC